MTSYDKLGGEATTQVGVNIKNYLKPPASRFDTRRNVPWDRPVDSGQKVDWPR